VSYTLIMGDNNEFDHIHGLTQEQAQDIAEMLTRQIGHASRSWAIADGEGVFRFTNSKGRWPIGGKLVTRKIQGAETKNTPIGAE
jgi:hypothetical protein